MDFEKFLTRYARGADITARVIQGQTYKKIGEDYKLSNESARRLYVDFTFRLYQLYISHICEVMDSNGIRDEAIKVWEFYLTYIDCIAYFEKKYNDILHNFRNGLPAQAIVSIIPYRHLTTETEQELTLKIIDEHENRKKSFVAILILQGTKQHGFMSGLITKSSTQPSPLLSLILTLISTTTLRIVVLPKRSGIMF